MSTPELFSKIDGGILKSSLMRQSIEVRWVFITCIILADADGCFDGDAFAISRFGAIPEADVEAALEILQAPDPYSTTPDNEGRRLIATGPNSWRIPNKPKYRAKHSKSEYLEADAARKREERARARVRKEQEEIEKEIEIESKSATSPDKSGRVRTSPDVSSFFSEWNTLAQEHGLPKCAKATPKRSAAAAARVREYGEESLGRVLSLVPTMPFLLGDNDRGWKCTIDFLLTPSGFVKVLEESYKKGKPGNSGVAVHAQSTAADDGWGVGVVRDSCVEAHGTDPDWEAYTDFACDYASEHGERKVCTFTEFKTEGSST